MEPETQGRPALPLPLSFCAGADLPLFLSVFLSGAILSLLPEPHSELWILHSCPCIPQGLRSRVWDWVVPFAVLALGLDCCSFTISQASDSPMVGPLSLQIAQW